MKPSNTTETTNPTATETATTETTTTETTRTEYRPTLGDIGHTHPDTDEAFGEAMVYRRGPIVAADGGEHNTAADTTEDEPEAEDAEDEDEDTSDISATDERMCDVDHDPPNGSEVNRVHERGGEGRDER